MIDGPPPGLVSMLVADATMIDRERRAAISRAEAAEAKLAEADNLVLLTTMRAEAAETSLAALKAENERLREELRVTEETSHAFISSFNPHELPSGKEDQWHASIEQCRRARTALETTNG